MHVLSREISFQDETRAGASLSKLSAEVPAMAMERVGLLLASSPNPDQALHYLVRLHEEQPAAFQRLCRSPAGLQYLVAVFGHSRFLSEELLQRPEWVEQIPFDGDMHVVLSPEDYRLRLMTALARERPDLPQPQTLALFRRQQILRILIRDVLEFATIHEVTEELSALADGILDVTYRRIRDELVNRYGRPLHQDASGNTGECGFSIIALGKLGGNELNYSSDIDLMFVYSGHGQTEGPEVIANREFFTKVANHLTDLLSTYTSGGKCYRVDLRLRPEGRLGEVCISVEGAKKYYKDRARDWELQMLIKARGCAGEAGPGQEILKFVQPYIYSSTLDFSAVESASETRARINEKLSLKKNQRGLDIKLAPGGIRDIEFLVQCLQRLHGGRELWLQNPGTLLSLRRLHDKQLLSDKEFSRLASTYTFLRQTEHCIQYDEDRQTHVLPESEDGLELLARKLPAARAGGERTAKRLRQRIEEHLASTLEIYDRVIHSQQPIYYGPSPEAPVESPGPTEHTPASEYLEPATSNLVRYLDQRAPELASALARSRLRRGAKSFEALLEHAINHPRWLGWLDSDPVLASYVFDIFEESSYFGDLLVRKPELIEELRRIRGAPGKQVDYYETVQTVADPPDLRRFFLREMFRIQSESLCLNTPIFDTLRHTSELADASIRASYRMAIEHVSKTLKPSRPDYKPVDQLMVVALGRLGMLEFDVASDADLIFILPDRDSEELFFWTRVAERLIQQITAYTGEGVIFSVDTRLRPNGREGMLVQTEQSFRDYFAHRAAAWEGIAFMKSRSVAGNTNHGTEFLNQLQDIDWRRYGQTARSRRMLWDMRMRLEKEQGASNPLKAGRGGYYDIDFCLMYLRLKAAGMFFKELNTPARIDVIERMGHLERADADFLRDAATFYRAVDHALRVYSGNSGGRLPRTQYKLEAVHRIVSRWTPQHLHDQPLDIELAQIQARTRESFERIFGSTRQS